MMRIIAVTGPSGAGKTTAVDFLENTGIGSRVYVGQFIVDEVIKKGLTVTPQNEKSVRLELRAKHGAAYLAHLAQPRVDKLLKAGLTPLVDAILTLDELNYYRQSFGVTIYLVDIDCTFENRAKRLALRGARSMTANELLERDALEFTQLRIDLTKAEATNAVPNNSTLSRFQSELQKLVQTFS